MKIRQKIAMLLAAAMTLTAVPMVTMAKSDFSLTKGIQIAEEDADASNKLKIEMEDATGSFMFFVNIKNAEFKVAAPIGTEVYNTNGVVVSYSNEKDGKEMVVEVDTTAATGNSSNADFYLPLNVVLKGGDATVAVDGNGTAVTDMSPVIFARTSDSKATVSVGDAETIYAESKAVAKIKIDEPFSDVLKTGKTIDFTVRHSDYEIESVVVTGEKGFNTYNTAKTAVTVNDDVYTFTIPAGLVATANTGRLVFEFTLDTDEKAPAAGDVNIKVSGDNVTTATVKVAEVKAYGAELSMDDDKVVDVTAGQNEEITFKLEEVVNDTFSENREFDLTFDNAFLAPRKDGAEYDSADAYKLYLDSNDEFDADLFVKGLTSEVPSELSIEGAILNDDDYIIGMTLKIDTLDDDDEDEFEFKDLAVFTALGASGDVTIKAEGRAIGEEVEVVAMNIEESVTVTAEPITVKVGLKEQSGGKIVISEADAGVIEQGKTIYVKIDDSDDTALKLKDTDIEDKVVVTSGDLAIDTDSITVKGGILSFEVKRDSTEASTITISDLTVYADRTVPQGSFDIKIGGDALTEDWSTSAVGTIKDLKVEEFIIVGTPNTEDITSNGLKKGVSSFVIGSSKYVVNGVEAEMDGAAYIDNGRTMVPVRYVANALGVDASDIYFAAGTATIIAGTKTVSLTIGDATAKLNGVPAKVMTAAPVVKDGRTYVPVAEIGALLGVDAAWDASAQSATFTNK